MRKQADFDRLYSDYFGKVPRKVMQEVRALDQSLDLALLNYVIHDSMLIPATVRSRGTCLTFPVEREYWELKSYEVGGLRYGAHLEEDHFAHSLLTIKPVSKVEWRFHGQADVLSLPDLSPERGVFISYVWVDLPALQDDERVPVIIVGDGWECIATAPLPDLIIRLRDLEVPHPK